MILTILILMSLATTAKMNVQGNNRQSSESNSHEASPDTIEESIKEDNHTVLLLKKLFEKPPSEEFRLAINLGFSSLITFQEFVHSLKDRQGKVKLPETHDVFGLEMRDLHSSIEGTEEHKKQIKHRYNREWLEEANYIIKHTDNFQSNYITDFMRNSSAKEELYGLYDQSELIPALRKHSINSLLIRFIATLQASSHESVFDTFSEDFIFFSKLYWQKQLLMYRAEDRSILSKWRVLYLGIRLALQNLSQIRLVRLDLRKYTEDLKLAIQELKEIIQESEIASGYNQDFMECQCEEGPISSTPKKPVQDGCQTMVEDIKRQLDFYPRPQIPREIKTMVQNFRRVDSSIQRINEVLHDMSSNDLFTQFKQTNSIIQEDLHSMSESMETFQTDFNSTLRFFGNLENTITMFYTVYEKYQTPLYVCLYIIISVVAIILVLQLMTVVIRIPNCIQYISTYTADFKEFRKQRNSVRTTMNARSEPTEFPLIRHHKQ